MFHIRTVSGGHLSLHDDVLAGDVMALNRMTLLGIPDSITQQICAMGLSHRVLYLFSKVITGKHAE